MLKHMINGKEVICSPEEEAQIKAEWAQNDAKQNHYARQRHKLYPSIRDQLDMLWHAMDNGEIPKASLFYNSIKEIKNKYPK